MTTTTHTTPPRALLDRAISEKAFQAQVLQLAALNGWLSFHPFDSRRSTPGYPDLTLVRNGCIIYAELKTQRGRLSASQRQWIAALEVCMAASGTTPNGWPLVAVYVWRPSMWTDIVRVLAGASRRTGAA